MQQTSLCKFIWHSAGTDCFVSATTHDFWLSPVQPAVSNRLPHPCSHVHSRYKSCKAHVAFHAIWQIFLASHARTTTAELHLFAGSQHVKLIYVYMSDNTCHFNRECSVRQQLCVRQRCWQLFMMAVYDNSCVWWLFMTAAVYDSCLWQ